MSLSKALLLAFANSPFLSSYALSVQRRDTSPRFAYDVNTTKDCTWWIDYDGSQPADCGQMLTDAWTNLEDFRRWNPTIGPNCAGLTIGKSYCVEALFEVPPDATSQASTSTAQLSNTSIKPTASSSSAVTTLVSVVSSTPAPTLQPSPTTSKPIPISSSTKPLGNGIQTPMPTQPDIVSNCNKFHDVDVGEQCSTVASNYGITLAKFLAWNPKAGSNCAGLWADAYACVGIIGEEADTTTTTTSSKPASVVPTTTSAGTGIATPQPTQPGIVSNCNKFYYVSTGVTCSQIISSQKVTLQDFVRWNPTVLADCSGLWAEVNVCVGVVGGSTLATSTTKATTTTTAGNGVQTPQPTQPGMVVNCAKFHFIAPGVTCSQVISYQKITRADFVKWNPTVNDDCSGLQANVNVCVGLIGGTVAPPPTPTTTAGNGIQTPQPTQPGMVANCKKFHYADTGVLCSQITSYNHISLADFVKWNPGVGSDCKNMWAKTYTCVGV